MRVALAALVASVLALGCEGDPRSCEASPAGEYSILFRGVLFACERDAFPKSIALDDKVFSKDGCEIDLDGPACTGGPGYCGVLRWTSSGVYEGELTYATMTASGNSGGISDCLIRSEEAKLTLVPRKKSK